MHGCCITVDVILFYNMLAMHLDEDVAPVAAHLNPNRTDLPKFPPSCHIRRFDAATVVALGSVKVGPAEPYMVHFDNQTELWDFVSIFRSLAVATMCTIETTRSTPMLHPILCYFCAYPHYAAIETFHFAKEMPV